jgi:hypothetical protein
MKDIYFYRPDCPACRDKIKKMTSAKCKNLLFCNTNDKANEKCVKYYKINSVPFHLKRSKKNNFGVPLINSLAVDGRNFPDGQLFNIPNTFMNQIQNEWGMGDNALNCGTVGRELGPGNIEQIYTTNYLNNIRMAEPAGQLGTALFLNRNCNILHNSSSSYPGLVSSSDNPQIVTSNFGKKRAPVRAKPRAKAKPRSKPRARVYTRPKTVRCPGGVCPLIKRPECSGGVCPLNRFGNVISDAGKPYISSPLFMNDFSGGTNKSYYATPGGVPPGNTYISKSVPYYKPPMIPRDQVNGDVLAFGSKAKRDWKKKCKEKCKESCKLKARKKFPKLKAGTTIKVTSTGKIKVSIPKKKKKKIN